MNASNSSALKGNLKSLVATGGMLAGAGAASQAAIIYTDITDITIPAGSGNVYFSLSGQDADPVAGNVNGGAQFRLNFTYSAGANPRLDGMAASGAVASYAIGPNNYARRLSGGAVINGSLTSTPAAELAYGSTGEWNPGNQGYLGLRFNAGAGDRFGWADVSYNANSSLTLYGFAYDDSGGSINAGQITAVPEPATTGTMAALFAGSLAAFEVRRRRKAEMQREPIGAI